MERIDSDHEDRVGVVKIRDLRSQLGPRELAEQAGVDRARGGVDVRGAPLPQDPLGQPALLVGRPAADQRGRPLTGVANPFATRLTASSQLIGLRLPSPARTIGRVIRSAS